MSPRGLLEEEAEAGSWGWSVAAVWCWLSVCTGAWGREGGEALLCLDIRFLSLEVSWQGRRKEMLPRKKDRDMVVPDE